MTIITDSMDFDDNFAESPMPYVDTEVTVNVTSTRFRRQGTLPVPKFFH
jgi:hypothetical protein